MKYKGMVKKNKIKLGECAVLVRLGVKRRLTKGQEIRIRSLDGSDEDGKEIGGIFASSEVRLCGIVSLDGSDVSGDSLLV